jgi:tetratricopeptide (TPR) repeat protein
MWSLGHLYAWSGRVAEGLAVLTQARDAVESIGLRSYHSLVLIQLGETYLLADRPEEALGIARGGLALAREHRQRGYEAWGLHLFGAIAAHRDPPDAETAEEHYREALALAGELGMRPLVAHCHLGLGKLYRRTGKREQAQEHLTAATTMYREMDMRFWLEKAEAD